MMANVPPVPRMWFVRYTSERTGRTHSVAVLVTHDSTEGSCVYEAFGPNDDDVFDVANGEWHIFTSDEASSLSLKFPDTCAIDDEVLDRLEEELCRKGLADTHTLRDYP